MDLTTKVALNSSKINWVTSPSIGVKRKPLERESAESGRATSLVEYQPGAKFSSHAHPFGEEILGLEGVLSDEFGDYPAGTYIRNPAGSSHAPYSDEGCLLFVKLNQFAEGDKQGLVANTTKETWLPGIGGLQVMPLHNFEHENVALVKWPANEKFQPHRHFGGEETLVLSGEFNDEHGSYPKHSWLRSPHMSEHFPFTKEETIIWVKTGHLPIS